MIIRNMISSDKDVFLDMSQDFYNSEATLHGFQKKLQAQNLEAFLDGSPYVRCLMLESESPSGAAPAGYALIAHSWSTEAGGPMIILEELYFIREARGKGGAKRFFQWFFEEYKDRAAGFRLEVAPDNAYVMDIYRKYGYEDLDYIQMIKINQ